MPRGVPATDAIPNFGEVTPHLYRSAQPAGPALESLARRGVKTIINLRMPGDIDPAEEVFARAHDIRYISVPMAGFSAPTDEEIARVLNLIERSPGPVLVHCQHGADRTGTVIAHYRITRQGWSVDAAMAEARRYGLSPFQLGMKDFIRRARPAR
jgi:tyrosine-protein phosphatase SIW14